MDFIEKLFGIAPDGGSGSLELLLFLVPLAGILYLAHRRRVHRTVVDGRRGRSTSD
jgi:hypothetical protein